MKSLACSVTEGSLPGAHKPLFPPPLQPRLQAALSTMLTSRSRLGEEGLILFASKQTTETEMKELFILQNCLPICCRREWGWTGPLHELNRKTIRPLGFGSLWLYLIQTRLLQSSRRHRWRDIKEIWRGQQFPTWRPQDAKCYRGEVGNTELIMNYERLYLMD